MDCWKEQASYYLSWKKKTTTQIHNSVDDVMPVWKSTELIIIWNRSEFWLHTLYGMKNPLSPLQDKRHYLAVILPKWKLCVYIYIHNLNLYDSTWVEYQNQFSFWVHKNLFNIHRPGPERKISSLTPGSTHMKAYHTPVMPGPTGSATHYEL